MLKLVSAIACELASESPPYTLKSVRKTWRKPPNQFCLYLEIWNYSGGPFDVTVELWRRSTKVAEFLYDLILMTKRDREELVTDIVVPELQPKTYSLRILLNGQLADTMYLDFGSKSAAP